MKKQLIACILACFVLAIILTEMSCSQGAGNNRSGNNQNANVTKANTAASTYADPDVDAVDLALFGDDGACSTDGLDARRQAVYDKLKLKIEKSSIGDQYAAKVFNFNVLKAPEPGADSLYLYIEGMVVGDRKLHVLEKLIKSFMKKKCTSRVIFVKKGDMPTGTIASATANEAFEWTTCDYPNVPCPGGECVPPGTSCLLPGPGANSNSNANMNSNAKPKAPPEKNGQ